MDASLTEQMTAILRAEGRIAACDRCGTPIVRRRRVRTDQPHYCAACRATKKRENIRLSARKRRAEGRTT